ncbi:MAG TPA: hypothetical protein VNM90_17140 [Haliangium sp.]|nr:hypothetical protein [Haliangium sp.]
MQIDDGERALLRKVLAYLIAHGTFPDAEKFRLDHAGQRAPIDALLSAHYLENVKGRYALTLAGLLACDSEKAWREIAACNALLPVLVEAYLADPGREWSVDALAEKAGDSVVAVARSLTFLLDRNIWSTRDHDPETGLIKSVRFSEGILDTEPIEWRTR